MAGTSRTVTVNVVGDATGLNKALSGVSSTAQSTGNKLKSSFGSAFTAITASSGGAFGPLQEVMQGLGPAIDGLSDKSAKFGEKMGAVGVGAAGAGMALQAFGSKDQAAEQQLAQAITNTGGTFDEYKAKINDTIKSGEKYGYQSGQTMQALQLLTTATGSAGTATKDFGAVANLAASQHIDLSSAASAYAKILSGKGSKTLAQYGISTAQVTAAMKASHGQMTLGQAAAQLLADKIKGQAAAASDTFTGKLNHLKAAVEDNVAKIGQKFGPALTMVGTGMAITGSAISAGSTILGHFKDAQMAAAAATDATTAAQAALAGEEGIASLATDAEAAATGLEDVALGVEDAELAVADVAEGIALAPILLIVAAVALLGVGIFELATHWSQVWGACKTVVVDAWHGIDNDFVHPIEAFFSSVPAFIKAHWQLILAILTGPIGLAVLFIKNNFSAIVSFISGIPSSIGHALSGVVGVVTAPFATATQTIQHWWNDIITMFWAFPGNMASIAASMFDWLGAAFRGALDEVIGLWNSLHFTIPGISVMGHHFGGETIGVPQVPYLAKGGIVNRPTLALIGEAGPEAVVPLSGANNPLHGGSNSGGHSHDIYLDGQKVGKALAQPVRKALLQTTGRSAGKVGLA